ncbi:uncharacterized protein CLUP02_01679 [Colletotrichum lupini]|uniref:Uncharacterized protein n=1 Tax=Colletotrichum lupini TaxID=145971 RepID=A0A9Q8SDN1_9PEZI|nr:uncharacterized protein CLUP02_01679 [Colletotrichum lupini]UQC75026.1 hypothetical protein CLUP02_01679 [Colletotrichum lupini]
MLRVQSVRSLSFAISSNLTAKHQAPRHLTHPCSRPMGCRLRNADVSVWNREHVAAYNGRSALEALIERRGQFLREILLSGFRPPQLAVLLIRRSVELLPKSQNNGEVIQSTYRGLTKDSRTDLDNAKVASTPAGRRALPTAPILSSISVRFKRDGDGKHRSLRVQCFLAANFEARNKQATLLRIVFQ